MVRQQGERLSERVCTAPHSPATTTTPSPPTTASYCFEIATTTTTNNNSLGRGGSDSLGASHNSRDVDGVGKILQQLHVRWKVTRHQLVTKSAASSRWASERVGDGKKKEEIRKQKQAS